MIDVLFLAAFALGFLCSCALFLVLGREKAPVYVQRVTEEADGSKQTVIEPVYRGKSSAPDNEKARKYATGRYQREKEEVITRGEGYTV
jgi:hypothetical protein